MPKRQVASIVRDDLLLSACFQRATAKCNDTQMDHLEGRFKVCNDNVSGELAFHILFSLFLRLFM